MGRFIQRVILCSQVVTKNEFAKGEIGMEENTVKEIMEAETVFVENWNIRKNCVRNWVGRMMS